MVYLRIVRREGRFDEFNEIRPLSTFCSLVGYEKLIKDNLLITL